MQPEVRKLMDLYYEDEVLHGIVTDGRIRSDTYGRLPQFMEAAFRLTPRKQGVLLEFFREYYKKVYGVYPLLHGILGWTRENPAKVG